MIKNTHNKYIAQISSEERARELRGDSPFRNREKIKQNTFEQNKWGREHLTEKKGL